MRYTLRQLEVFLATVEQENITKAADLLAMSQSAASGALKDLESQFDIQLFDRVGKRLHTNELGRRMQPIARALLDQAKELQQELEQHQSPSELHVGATLTIGNYLAVNLVAEYMRRHSARASLRVANTAHIVEDIEKFHMDVGLIEGEIQHADLNIVPWRSDELVCFCSPDHPLAQEGLLAQSALATYPWILREPGSGTRQTFDRVFHESLSELDIWLELEHTEAIKKSVQSGLGISCLSQIAVEDAFAAGDLVPLATPYVDLHRKFYAVWHRKKYMSAGITAWLDLLNLAGRH